MIDTKPKFWEKKYNFFSIFLAPLSLLILIYVYLKKKITKSLKFEVPIICVGNIYIGGTGKTPTSLFIANELRKLGKNPVIVRKFYKGHVDEHNLIKEKFNDLILDKNRVLAIKKAQKLGYDIIILDDGFQDRKIKKDLSIICFNQNQLIGNGFVLPAGPLRESLAALKDANVVLINGKKDDSFEKKILSINKNLYIFYSDYIPANLDEFKNKKLLAVAGIGNPENFFKMLEENKLIVEKKVVYPDHYQFTTKEFENIVEEAEKRNLKIIMTEKDFFKIKDLELKKNSFLKISLKIKKHDDFLNLLKRL